VTAARTLVVMACAAVLFTACSKCNAPAKQKVAPPAASVEPHAAATTGSTAALRVSTSVNGATAATIHRGWPLVITASVSHDGPAITVPATGGSWTGAARVELTAEW